MGRKRMRTSQIADIAWNDDLLWNKLPEWMSEKQKKVKVNNLLSELRRIQKIENQGTFKMPKWVLIK